jgi:hypothetical protein
MKLTSKKVIKSILFLISTFIVAAYGCKSGEEKPTKPETAPRSQDDAESESGLTPEQAAKVVAKVGERTITVGDITDQINRLSPYIRRRWSAPEKRKEFLDNLIRVELLSQEADRLGLGKESPEIDRVINQVMIRLMIKNDLEKEIIPSKVDEETLKKTYEEEKSKYQRPPQVRASHIVVKTKAEADKLIADLDANKNDNRYFREQAKKLSVDDATKEKGGDLGYFSETGERNPEDDKIDAEVAKTAWALTAVGEISKTPIQTAAGFHVIKLTNKRPKLNRSFESVKRMIESRILREKRKEALDKFVEDLQSKANVEIFEENLAKVKVPMGGPMMGQPVSRPKPPKGASVASKSKKNDEKPKKEKKKETQ